MSLRCGQHGWQHGQQKCPQCEAYAAGQAAAAAAFPPPITPQPGEWTTVTGGLTKRELFAAMAMQDLQNVLLRTSGEGRRRVILDSNGLAHDTNENLRKAIAIEAVRQADALLAELAK